MHNQKDNNLSKYNRPVCLILVILLLVAPAKWPYGFYIFLRWTVTAGTLFLAYLALRKEKTNWVLTILTVALLYNPILPVYLDKGTWSVLNILSAVLLIAFAYQINADGNS